VDVGAEQQIGAVKAVYDMSVQPVHIAEDTVLTVIIGSLVLLGDLAVRSRPDA
jgi:hypothetical protein